METVKNHQVLRYRVYWNDEVEAHADWLVAPVRPVRYGDYGVSLVDESNDSVFSEMLVSDDIEHAALEGYYLVHPRHADWLQSVCDGLESYPLLSDDDYSRREYEAITERWERMSLQERIEACARCGVSIFAARRDAIDWQGHGPTLALWGHLHPDAC